MSANCCTQRDYYTKDRQRDKRYCRVLWAVLGVNAAMFLVEIVAGLAVDSVSL